MLFLWFFDKFRILSQTKVKNNTSFGHFYFQLLSNHGICQRMFLIYKNSINSRFSVKKNRLFGFSQNKQ